MLCLHSIYAPYAGSVCGDQEKRLNPVGPELQVVGRWVSGFELRSCERAARALATEKSLQPETFFSSVHHLREDSILRV